MDPVLLARIEEIERRLSRVEVQVAAQADRIKKLENQAGEIGAGT